MTNEDKITSIIKDRLKLARNIVGFKRTKLMRNNKFLNLLGKELSYNELRRIEETSNYRDENFDNFCDAFFEFIGTEKETFIEIENDTDFEEIVESNWGKKTAIDNISNKSFLIDKIIKTASNDSIENIICEIDRLFSQDDSLFLKALLDIKKNVMGIDKYSNDLKTNQIDLIIVIYNHLIKKFGYEKKVFKDILEQIQKFAINKNKEGCEKLIRLLIEWDIDRYENKIYLTGLDLSNLNLSYPDNALYRYSLETAWFKNTDITNTDFSGLNLDYAIFDYVKSAKNACFKNTSLKDTTFIDANLSEADFRGVNRDQNNDQIIFINGMSIEDAGKPFLDAKTMANAKVDKWLKDFLIKYKKGYLLTT